MKTYSICHTVYIVFETMYYNDNRIFTRTVNHHWMTFLIIFTLIIMDSIHFYENAGSIIYVNNLKLV